MWKKNWDGYKIGPARWINGFMLHLGLPVFTVLKDSRHAGCFGGEQIAAEIFFFFFFSFLFAIKKKWVNQYSLHTKGSLRW